jgi:hypothetical protein
MSALFERSVTIPASGTQSAAFGTGQATRGSFQLPAGMTGTTTTFEVTNEDTPTNWQACPIEGNETNPLTTASSKSYSFPTKLFNFKFARLVSGTTETADRVIRIFTRE